MPSAFTLLATPLIIIFLIQAARLFWTVATPVQPLGNWHREMPVIIKGGARLALFASYDPFSPQHITDSQDAERVTSLLLTLFGVRSNEITGAGSAIIGSDDGVQASYLVGQEVQPGVKLHSVGFDHVTLENNGSLEKLYLDQSVPAEVIAPQAVTSASSPAIAASGDLQVNPQTLVASIGLAPRNEGGRVTGLVVSVTDNVSLVRSAGLIQGDIITKVNGKTVSSGNEIASQIRPGARLSLEIERNGSVVPVALILENP